MQQLQKHFGNGDITRAIHRIDHTLSQKWVNFERNKTAKSEDELQESTQNLLLREAQRFFQGGRLEVNPDPTLMGALEAIFILATQITNRLKKVTKPQLLEQLMKRIQQDLANTLEGEDNA